MAITRHELTMTLSPMLTQAKFLLKTQGYMFPYLYVLNKGASVLIEIEHPTVVGADCEEADITKGEDHIYRSVLGCKISNEEDDKAIGEIAERIAQQYNPDAIALYISCVYTEFRKGDIDKELKKLGSLHRDPEAIRVLHACAFSRTDPEPVMTNIPFLHRGQIKTDPGDPEKYDVTFVEFPWSKPLTKIGPKILDPYRSTRR